MSIDATKVREIAMLARLPVPEEEEEQVAKELNKMLELMEQLAQVDITGVKPMTSVARQKLPQRKDEISDGGYASDLLANGPEATADFFVVPKVIE